MNENILNFLKDNNIAVLSIVRGDGSVHGASIHFSNSDDGSEFYFATSKNSRKVEYLLNGAAAQASLVVGFKEDEMITLQLDGSIKIAKEDELPDILEIHYAKHSGATRFKDDPNTIHLIFTPQWWRFSKFMEKPPVFLESDKSV